MAEETKRIQRHIGPVSSLKPGMICIEDSDDTDLGYRMLCHKDEAGSTLKSLSKDMPAFISTLRLTGPTTTTTTGLLKHDAVGNVTGGKITIEQLEELIDGDLVFPAALDDGAVGYGDSEYKLTGDIDKLSFDDSLNIFQVHDGKAIIGDNVSIDEGADSLLAIHDDYGTPLSIGDISYESVITGTGSFNGYGSFVNLNASNVGVGYDTHSPYPINQGLVLVSGSNIDGEHLLAIGTSLDVQSSFSNVIGNNITANGAFQEAIGDSLSNTHGYSGTYGKYAKSIAKGSCNYAYERYDSQSGNCQRTVLELVGVTNGGTGEVVLRAQLSDTGPSFVIGEKTVALVKGTLFSSIYNPALGATDGYRVEYDHRWACWYNGTYTAEEGVASFSAITRAFSPTVAFGLYSTYGENGDGEFNIVAGVSANASGHVIIHRATIEMIIAPSSYAANS